MNKFIIRNKYTLEQWFSLSGKGTWNNVINAKNAFKKATDFHRVDKNLVKHFETTRFDEVRIGLNDQIVYEIIELVS